MFSTVSGILMALFLDNVGGAWVPVIATNGVGLQHCRGLLTHSRAFVCGAQDNAKKFVELGNFGGKGSEAHKASVTGDTVTLAASSSLVAVGLALTPPS